MKRCSLFSRFSAVVAIMLWLSVLTGCGQKGPLVLPPKPDAKAQAKPANPAPANPAPPNPAPPGTAKPIQ